MEDDTRRLLDLLAAKLEEASLLCGKIIGNDDFANEPIARKSPFRIVSEGGKPSDYPKVKFQLLTEKRAEEVAVAVYLPYGTGSIRKRTRENKNSRYSWWEGRFRHRTVTAKTKQEAYDKLKELARTEVSEGKTDKKEVSSSLYEWVEYNAVKLAFGKIFKKLSLEGVSVHSTRHTFASMCHLANINELLTKKWLGHATLAMTKDVYTHFLKRENSPFSAYFEQLKDFER